MAKFLTQTGGVLTEVIPNTTSAGAGDAAKIPQTDSSGRLDSSFLPVGIGADTNSIQASEALSANDLVNVWSSGGQFRVRKADASSSKPAHGFVKTAVSSGTNATVYARGTNSGLTGLAPGDLYLSATTPGAVAATSPTGGGVLSQRVGTAVSATDFNFVYSAPIVQAS